MSGPGKCYACPEQTLLDDGATGLCSKCEAEARARREMPSAQETCRGCGHRFVTDWERQSHEVLGKHHYRAWSASDGTRAAERFTARQQGSNGATPR